MMSATQAMWNKLLLKNGFSEKCVKVTQVLFSLLISSFCCSAANFSSRLKALSNQMAPDNLFFNHRAR
jgi:hypothetical protein